jgi:ABC-type uncharacterized transport system substrate-binding protein
LSDPGPTSPTVLALMQVLDGRSPATLPVQDPRGFQLTLNARAAAQQGLQPSLPLLHRVDRIVPPQACPRTGSASAACP